MLTNGEKKMDDKEHPANVDMTKRFFPGSESHNESIIAGRSIRGLDSISLRSLVVFLILAVYRGCGLLSSNTFLFLLTEYVHCLSQNFGKVT